MAGGAARLSSLADLGKVIVMVLLMVVLMMAMRDAREIWSVEAIIARNSVCIFMKKTTVVMILPQLLQDLHQLLWKEPL